MNLCVYTQRVCGARVSVRVYHSVFQVPEKGAASGQHFTCYDLAKKVIVPDTKLAILLAQAEQKSNYNCN